MKVNRAAFEKFLDLVILKGDLQSKEAKITMHSNGFEIIKKNGMLCGIVAKFIVPSTETDEDIKEFGIMDLVGFRKLFKGFKSDTIDISKVSNKLVVTADKIKASFEVEKAEYVDVDTDKSKMLNAVNHCNQNVVMVSSQMAKEITTVANGVKPTIITFQVVDECVSINFFEKEKSAGARGGSKSEILLSTDIKLPIPNREVSIFGSSIDILNTIGGEFEFSANDGLPVYIKTSSDNYSVKYMLNPRKEQ